MRLRNENIGIAVGMTVLGVGLFLTGGDPGEIEGAIIGILMLAAAWGISLYLNERGNVYERSLRR
jgi:hypothetical protein